MSLYSAAIKYLEHGLAVIPLWPDRRKNPHLSSYSEYCQRLPTGKEWAKWARQWPAANLGLITGYWLNHIALDFDTVEAYETWLTGPGWAARGQTWTVQTGRGYHVWFQVREDPGSSRKYQAGPHEVLLRARGGYCIVPPSVHHSGRPYRTIHRVAPLEIASISYYLEGWQEVQVKTAAKPMMGTRPQPGRAGSIPRIEQLIPIPEGSRPNARGAYQVYCPFHDDSKPSAWLNPDQQRFGCNACWPGLWWDAVNVYAFLKGLDNGQAYKELVGTEALRSSAELHQRPQGD